MTAALADLANPPRNGAARRTPSPRWSRDGDLDGLAAHIAAGMEEAGLSPSAGRTPEEIARRLIEKAELRSVRLSAEAFAALKTFLAIDVPLDRRSRGAGALRGRRRPVARRGAGQLSPPAPRRSPRRACRRDTIRYDAAFGRPLDYYTGLVFEIAGRRWRRGRWPAAAATTGC